MRRIVKLYALAATALLLLIAGAGTVGASALSPEAEFALERAGPTDEIAVIAKISPSPDFKALLGGRRAERAAMILALREKAHEKQAGLKEFLRKRGASRLEPLWTINAIAVKARPEVIRELAARPEVESIRLDELLSAPSAQVGEPAQAEWNLHLVRAPELWAVGFTGHGVVVAGMDTGVDLHHPDLKENWRGGLNSWFDPNGQHAAPHDASGHGTQTMSIMVGGSAAGSAVGVAPDATWIAVKIFDDSGQASLSNIHLGFQWLLDPDGDPSTNDAPQVVNASWGLSNQMNDCILEFQQDLQVLRASGIAVVFSAGNDGPASLTSLSPANYPESISAGAVDAAPRVPSFSSRGPSACDGSIYPDLVAPGVNVKAADLTFGGLFPLSYAYVNGTSFSAAHVSGVLALLSGARPDATPVELEQALKLSAGDLGSHGPDNESGYGLVDALEAYNLLASPSSCHDQDGDGFGDPPDPSCAWADPDCDDANPDVYPGAPELPDAIDNQCAGDVGDCRIDEGFLFALIGPSLGASVRESPLFRWSAGTYDSFRVTVTASVNGQRTRVVLQTPCSEADLSAYHPDLWDSIDSNTRVRWSVTGSNRATRTRETAGPWWFRKVGP